MRWYTLSLAFLSSIYARFTVHVRYIRGCVLEYGLLRSVHSTDGFDHVSGRPQYSRGTRVRNAFSSVSATKRYGSAGASGAPFKPSNHGLKFQTMRFKISNHALKTLNHLLKLFAGLFAVFKCKISKYSYRERSAAVRKHAEALS